MIDYVCCQKDAGLVEDKLDIVKVLTFWLKLINKGACTILLSCDFCADSAHAKRGSAIR